MFMSIRGLRPRRSIVRYLTFALLNSPKYGDFFWTNLVEQFTFENRFGFTRFCVYVKMVPITDSCGEKLFGVIESFAWDFF